MDGEYTVSVIMPALNEEDSLVGAVEDVIGSFSRLNVQGEVIIVNDGSTDDTPRIARGLADRYPFISVIDHRTPMGIGASFWDGVRKAQGEIVVMLPGDGENDAYEILRYLPLMNDVDIVVPFVYNQTVRSWSRRLISRTYRTIINVSFGMLLNYMNGTVMYRRCVLQDVELRARGFFYQTELLVKCIRRGYLYAEVPYGLKRRDRGTSKAMTLKALSEVIKGYLSTVAEVYFNGGTDGGIAEGSVTASRKKRLSAFERKDAKGMELVR